MSTQFDNLTEANWKSIERWAATDTRIFSCGAAACLPWILFGFAVAPKPLGYWLALTALLVSLFGLFNFSAIHKARRMIRERDTA